jgi:glycine/D-amino acid oxidase-like deaminating enzyme
VKQTPFWVEDHPRPEGLTSDLPSETDYLVVGSGLTGLSAALRLAAAGRSVTVIEAGEIAGGASAINGGMVSPDVKAGIDNVYAIYGPRIGHEMWASTVRSVELVRDYAIRPGVGALTHDNGMAALGHGARKLKSFDRSVDWYHEKFGVDWTVLDARDIGTVVGGDSFNVALFEPEGFGVHPARLAFGLAREVQREVPAAMAPYQESAPLSCRHNLSQARSPANLQALLAVSSSLSANLPHSVGSPER